MLTEVLFVDGPRSVRALDVTLADDPAAPRLAVRRSRRPALERLRVQPLIDAPRRSLIVHEVRSERGAARLFVVHSDAWLARDRAARERAMSASRAALQKLADRVARGDLRSPLRIAQSATRILERHDGARYYDWRLSGRSFRFFERPDLARELALEGKLVIEVERSALGAVGSAAPGGQPRGRVGARAVTAALALLLERAALGEGERGATLSALATGVLRAFGAARVVYGPMSEPARAKSARAPAAARRPRWRLP